MQAPIIGGYLAQNVSWRWNYHITYITGFALAIYCFFFTPETLADELLRKKAAYLRKRTGDQRWKAPKEDVPMKHVYKESITKVIKILVTEPLVQFNTAYLTLVYFCLFGYLEGAWNACSGVISQVNSVKQPIPSSLANIMASTTARSD